MSGSKRFAHGAAASNRAAREELPHPNTGCGSSLSSAGWPGSTISPSTTSPSMTGPGSPVLVGVVGWIRLGPGSAGPVTVGPDGAGPVGGGPPGPAAPPSSGGRGVPRRTRTRRGPNRSPAAAEEIRRSVARRATSRASCRPGGSASRIPSAAVTRPGIASSTPAPSPTRPSVTWLPGGRPASAAALNPRHARIPSRRSSNTPAAEATSTSSTAKPKPIQCATSTNTATSTTAVIKIASGSQRASLPRRISPA